MNIALRDPRLLKFTEENSFGTRRFYSEEKITILVARNYCPVRKTSRSIVERSDRFGEFSKRNASLIRSLNILS